MCSLSETLRTWHWETSVLFLVPGIPYLNSVCDMLTGHHQLGMGRMVEATILTACLSLGFCGAIVIMKIA